MFQQFLGLMGGPVYRSLAVIRVILLAMRDGAEGL